MNRANLQKVSISDVVVRARTWNPARDAADNNISYIDLSAIDNATKAVNGFQSLVGRDAPSRARQLVQAGDILISTVRPNLNGVARVPDELDGGTASTGFCVLRPQPGKVDSSFLFHWVQSPDFVADMVRKATGASYPAVSDKIIFQSAIPLPALAEQRRIAAILDQADALRSKRQCAVNRLDQLCSAMFNEMFGNLDQNPYKFSPFPLSKLIRVQGGFAFKSEYFTQSGEPVIRISNVDGKSVDVEGSIKIAPSNVGKGSSFKIDVGDLLIAMSGATTGKIGVVPSFKGNAYLNQRVGRYVILEPSKIERRFLTGLVQTEFYRKRILDQAWGAAQPNVSSAQLVSFDIPLPPIPLQKQYGHFVECLEQTMITASHGLSAAKDLFLALQHRAFKGEL